MEDLSRMTGLQRDNTSSGNTLDRRDADTAVCKKKRTLEIDSM